MVVMAEAYGADTQLVAFMQYLRVVVVAASAAIVARVAGVDTTHAAGVATQAAAWFPPIHWVPLLETIALCVLGAFLGIRLRIQAGALLVPMAAAILFTRFGWMTIELPRWLLSLVYAVLGWRIGLGFTRPLLLHAARVLPRVLACTLALVVFCAGLGGLLVVLVGVDPLTAYLATSPGGADSVAIIASATQVDASFVMAMQMARLLAVLLLAPVMTRMMGAFAGAQRPVS
jgi:membrane AbrB-like protein